MPQATAGMLLRAAANHNIDLSASWMIGDILDDVEAGKRAGCRAILVDLGTEQPPDQRQTFWRRPAYVARSTIHALQIVQALEGLYPAPEEVNLVYQPDSWRRGPVSSASAASPHLEVAKAR